MQGIQSPCFLSCLSSRCPQSRSKNMLCKARPYCQTMLACWIWSKFFQNCFYTWNSWYHLHTWQIMKFREGIRAIVSNPSVRNFCILHIKAESYPSLIQELPWNAYVSPWHCLELTHIDLIEHILQVSLFDAKPFCYSQSISLHFIIDWNWREFLHG